MDEQKKFYNTQEAADILGILRASLRRKAHDAGIGTMLNGRAMIFTPEDIKALQELPDGRGEWQSNEGRTHYLEALKNGTFKSKKEQRAEQAAAASPSL